MIPLFKPYMPAKLPDLDRIIQSGQLAYGKYAREFEELKKYFEDEGRNATPQ